LKAIKLMAQIETNTADREGVLKVLREWLTSPSADNTPASNSSLQLFTALLLMQDGNTKEAVKALQNGNTLEQKALLVQLYLKMDRADVAGKVLKSMVSADEDSTLTQIASAWLHMANGKSVEATYIFDELSDKHGDSSLLKNGSAVAKMQLGEFADAESLLQDSLRTNPNDPDTLANLIAVSQHLNKAPEVVNRYLKQLQNVAPSHQLVLSLATFEQAFDRVAATFAKGTKV
jgi:coatomer subunit epsilon